MPTAFIQQRHAAYHTPQPLLFALIRQSTGDEPIRHEQVVRGYDNEVYVVETRQGNAYIVRLQQHGRTGYAEEQWAIEQCRAVGVPVAEICHVGALTVGDQNKPVMVQRRVAGRPLSEVQAMLTQDERVHIYHQLGAALSKIHSIAVGGFYKLNPDGVWDFPDWESIAQANVRDRTAERPQLRQAGLTDAEIDALLALIIDAVPPINRQPVLCHGDFRPEHLFVDAALTLTGVIDFGEFQGGLPHVDFVSLSVDCSPAEMISIQAGYSNKALFTDAFAQRLRYHQISYLLGSLAYFVQIQDHEGARVSVDALRMLER
jgi:aminoglycoside phosphotransferase (APT) family kinase protein